MRQNLIAEIPHAINRIFVDGIKFGWVQNNSLIEDCGHISDEANKIHISDAIIDSVHLQFFMK